MTLAAAPGRIDVRGGAGGRGVGKSVGGDGGTGLVRLESASPLSGFVQAEKLRADTIRFQVVFDGSTGLVPGVFAGVTNLRILAKAK